MRTSPPCSFLALLLENRGAEDGIRTRDLLLGKQ
jgi:hypothetical protein